MTPTPGENKVQIIERGDSIEEEILRKVYFSIFFNHYIVIETARIYS